MKRRILYLAPVLMLTAAVAIFSVNARTDRAASVPQSPEKALTAAPGRVEPVSEEIDVSPEIGGRIAQVFAEEGGHVRKGQTLAVIDNADYRAKVDAAEATLQQRQAELDRILNGARPEELNQARIAVEAAKSVMDNARSETDRRRTLVQRGAVSEEEFEHSAQEHQIAKSHYEDAVEHSKLVVAGARSEERDRARADVRVAEASLAEAKSYLEKTVVRSPIAGIVLRKHARAGESVSDRGQTPVFTVADDSVLRVRVDVDEVDVARLALGQNAFVKADAFGNTTFPGKVVRIGRVLGKKNIVTDQPKERMDNKVLEVLIELQNGHELPIGLRVDAFIQTGTGK
jgi:HlyD family secretion protein